MTQRLAKLIENIEDEYIRGFLSAADAKDSPASIYTMAALEKLAERVLALETAAKGGGEQ